jgi:hypothetical protein
MNPNKPVDLFSGSKTDRLDARLTRLEQAVAALDGALSDMLIQSGIIARFAKRKLGLDDSTISSLQNELAFEQHQERMNGYGFEESDEPIALGDCASVLAKADGDEFGVPALAEISDDEAAMAGLRVGDSHTKETPQGNLKLEVVKIYKKKAVDVKEGQ